MIAAASDAFYNDGEACGQTYEVTCISGTNLGTPMPCLGGSVVVKIVDYCKPESCRGTIDLSEEPFASIADTASGVINVSYQKYELHRPYISSNNFLMVFYLCLSLMKL